MKTRLTQALLISLLIITTGCEFYIPFTDDSIEPELVKATAPQQAPIVTNNPAFNPINHNICESQCAKYGGLKKKFCMKKCESKLKKEKQ